jgi:hypothetical protein
MEVPIELFFGFIGVTLTLVAIGLAKGVPALLVFAGMFLLMWTVVIDDINMGNIPRNATTSGATTTYDYIDDPYPFISWPKVIFSLFSVVLMLVGALLTKMGANNL